MIKIKKILPLIGIIIFIYIIYSVGINKIITAFLNMNLKYLFYVFLFIALEMLCLTYKWYVIIHLQGFNLSFLKSVEYYLKGNFYGFITPSRAGSLIRAAYLKKLTGKSIAECSSGIVVERIFDMIVILLYASIGAIYIAHQFAGLFTTMVLFLFGFIALSIFFLSKKRAGFVLGIIYKFIIPLKFKDRIKEFFHLFYSSLPSTRKLVYPFLLTLITWFVAGLVLWPIGLLFGIKLPFLLYVILNPIAIAIGMIPITVGGLGTREVTLIALFLVFNISAESTFSMSLVSLVLASALPALIGFLLIIKRKESKPNNEINNEASKEFVAPL